MLVAAWPLLLCLQLRMAHLASISTAHSLFFLACCWKDLYYFDSWPLALCQTLQLFVCVFEQLYYVWVPGQNDKHEALCRIVFVCVVRASQSKQWLKAKWPMKKLHLRKWPLEAVLSVLEGLQGHYTHHTHTTQTHTDIRKWVCVLEGLWGRYPTNGAIWSQNKHKLFLPSACNKVMKMLISFRWRNQQKRTC